jgi:hypothetical protein
MIWYDVGEINERIGNDSEFYHLAKSLLWNKDIDRKYKITIHNVYFKEYYYVEQRQGHVLRQRKLNYNSWDKIPGEIELETRTWE